MITAQIRDHLVGQIIDAARKARATPVKDYTEAMHRDLVLARNALKGLHIEVKDETTNRR